MYDQVRLGKSSVLITFPLPLLFVNLPSGLRFLSKYLRSCSNLY
jgi:hypothetical protein